jgi:hypothetical protein
MQPPKLKFATLNPDGLYRIEGTDLVLSKADFEKMQALMLPDVVFIVCQSSGIPFASTEAEVDLTPWRG